MAQLDFGVIALKNGKLYSEDMGAASTVEIGSLVFYKTYPYEQKHINKALNHKGHFVDVKIDSIPLRVKTNGQHQFITLLSYKGDEYAILSGYDIDFHDFYTSNSKVYVRNFLKYYLKD